MEGGYKRIDERICPCFSNLAESARETVSVPWLGTLSTVFFCLEPWSKDCMTFTLHDLTDFYVERVTAYCIKINYHSCFHNRFLNSKTKLKLKHILEQGGPWCLGLYACLCACVSVSLGVCVWFMRTQMCIMAWVCQVLQEEGDLWGHFQCLVYYKYVYTHKECVLMTGASSAEESTDIVQACMIVQTYMTVQTYIGITQKEWNITPI